MKTECPHCGQHYEVDKEYIDQIVECISCGQEFVVEMIRSGTDDTQEDFVQERPVVTSAGNHTNSKENVDNKPKSTEETNADTMTGCGCLLAIIIFLVIIINSCEEEKPNPKGPPTAEEWVRFLNKVKENEQKKEEKLWDDIRNY